MDFSSEIALFKQNGILTSQIDDGGNIYLSSKSPSFNQHYVSIPLEISNYNIVNVEEFYPIEFTEFISNNSASISASMTDLNSQLLLAQQQNSILTSQLNNIIAEQQNSNSDADSLAAMQVIINLRISLGQGNTSSDFSTTFPYAPLNGSAGTIINSNGTVNPNNSFVADVTETFTGSIASSTTTNTAISISVISQKSYPVNISQDSPFSVNGAAFVKNPISTVVVFKFTSNSPSLVSSDLIINYFRSINYQPANSTQLFSLTLWGLTNVVGLGTAIGPIGNQGFPVLTSGAIIQTNALTVPQFTNTVTSPFDLTQYSFAAVAEGQGSQGQQNRQPVSQTSPAVESAAALLGTLGVGRLSGAGGGSTI